MATPKTILKFYSSKVWRRARALKKATARGVCEKCGNAGWEVHHIIPLTLSNINDLDKAIGQDNLMLLCTACHNSMRAVDSEVRSDLKFDADGNLVKKIKEEMKYGSKVFKG